MDDHRVAVVGQVKLGLTSVQTPGRRQHSTIARRVRGSCCGPFVLSPEEPALKFIVGDVAISIQAVVNHFDFHHPFRFQT
jgi:hypothetical protein